MARLGGRGPSSGLTRLLALPVAGGACMLLAGWPGPVWPASGRVLVPPGEYGRSPVRYSGERK
eukprot:9203514-Heterocapsa_arctica.AAC.1